MTDLEMISLCAEAMNEAGRKHGAADYFGQLRPDKWIDWRDMSDYDPLHDDAQAMALAKRFMLEVDFFSGTVSRDYAEEPPVTTHSDESINRAIVECVAKMQLAKGAVDE